MLPRLASSAFACLKAPEVQFMLYFISPKGKCNFSNFYVDCSPKVLSEYAQFCSVYKNQVFAMSNLKFLHENDQQINMTDRNRTGRSHSRSALRFKSINLETFVHSHLSNCDIKTFFL